jgi:hypothetical protein
VKPGPPRLCECGECVCCKHRAHREKYYQRNAKRLIQLSAEYRRRRKKAALQKPLILSGRNADDDLDRKAAEWLAQH